VENKEERPENDAMSNIVKAHDIAWNQGSLIIESPGGTW